jgi:NAD(P)-dependent dehydrogenase (short-subunit alcohol dehydrogenase family)
MNWQHALIMGASGGIGIAIARKLASDPATKSLILCAAHATSHEGLQQLQQACIARSKFVLLLDVDFTDESAMTQWSAKLATAMPELDLVINTAGLLHDGSLAPEKSATQISAASMQRIFAVNAFGPMLLIKAMWPWLRQKRPVLFATLSARVGSIEDNRLGGWYSYRAAKAAQNQFLKTAAIELARINPQSIMLALHPGTTDTGLSRPYQANVASGKLFTPEFVAERLLEVLTNATPAQSGTFMAWDGQVIPW